MQITTTSVDQAIAQLAAADYNSQHAPIVVLTDLNDDWRFFWFEKDGEQTVIRVTKTSQQKAFEWIRQRCNELAPRRERQHGRKKAAAVVPAAAAIVRPWGGVVKVLRVGR